MSITLPRFIHLSVQFVLFPLFVGLTITYNFGVSKQRLENWSPQQRIPGYKTKTHPIFIIADQDRTVHAFCSQTVGEENPQTAIVYNQWTLNQGWTQPVDILLPPLRNEARLLGAFLDQTGMMHVLFFGGDNTNAKIYYSRAPAVNSGMADAWSSPIVVGDDALDPENGAIIGDNKGNMVIIYSGKTYGNGLYVIYSADYGESWSKPDLYFQTYDEQLTPFDSKVVISQSGQVFAVWSVYDVTGNGISAYFARLNLTQRQWSDPLNLAPRGWGGLYLPNIIEYDGNLIVTFYSSTENAHWMVQSSDYGQTWMDPVRIAPNLIGRNGAVSMVIDSNNVLHMLFGERRPGKTDIHGVWHVTYVKGHLDPVQAVVSGPQVVDKVNGKGFDPVNVQAVISQGNVLLVTWLTDPGIGNNGVWYSFSILNTFEMPLKPLPTQHIPISITLTPAVTSPMIIPSKAPELVKSETESKVINPVQSSSILGSPITPLVLGIIPVLLIIFVTIIYTSISSKRR